MFSATITGTIQRVIYDNGKDGADAMVKVTLCVPKQFTKKDDDNSHIFPLITIFGYNADYLRKYAGKGQIISCINCELDLYRNEKFEDDNGNNPETASFTTRTVHFPKKAIMEALVEAGVAEEAAGDDDDDDRSSKRGKKKGSKSRSERRSGSSKRGRSRDDDDDDDDEDEEEEEKPRRKSRNSKTSSSKKPSSKKKPKDDDDDYDDDYDDDDDYFEDED